MSMQCALIREICHESSNNIYRYFCHNPTYIFSTKTTAKIKELEKEKERIERSLDRWEKYYKDYIQKLESGVDELMKMRVIGNPKLSQDIVDAVRYAMKKSHPDNGGNAEDFVRFKKCYEELAGR